MSETITRLAPSPTGALHLGNARTFLLNHLLARRNGWRVLMRIEDLDSPRVRAGSAEDTLDDLSWLGLEWEEPPVYQSRRTDAYQAALKKLVAAGLAYPCLCSRKDIELAAGAPHRDETRGTYPGTCRGRFADEAQARAASPRPPAWRAIVDDVEITFEDRFAGKQRFNLSVEGGDFVVFRSHGLAAYQLAVTVDDAESGVNAIVRADDLLDSAARQIHLRRLLNLPPEVEYWHVPLVEGEDGRRLAKRHGDTRLSYYRRRGASAERMLGLLGYWCGLLERRREASMDELIGRFDISLVPKEPVVFTRADDEYLLKS